MFGRLMLGIGALRGIGLYGSSLIQSIQNVSITLSTAQTTNTATITAVDPNNTLLAFGFHRHIIAASTSISDVLTRVDLTNGTTVTATRNDTAGGTSQSVVTCMVIEFKPGVIKSIQRGTITIAAASSTNTASVNAVNTAKSMLNFVGQTTSAVRTEDGYARLDLTNATTITATRSNTNNAITIGYELVEFW